MSTPSRATAALSEILDHIDYARSKVDGVSRAQFVEDRDAIYIVTRCLEIISEASRRLEDEVRARHVDIPWRQLFDAGNVYRHGYETVSPGRLFDTLIDDLPALETAVRAEIDRLKLIEQRAER